MEKRRCLRDVEKVKSIRSRSSGQNVLLTGVKPRLADTMYTSACVTSMWVLLVRESVFN